MKKIILLGAPSERPFYMRNNIPPLSLGVLQGYLIECGFDISLHDLNVSLARNRKELDRERWAILYNRVEFLNSLEHKINERYAILFERLLEDISFADSKLAAISLGSNYSFFEIHSGFLLGKWIREKYQIPVVFGGENVEYLLDFREQFRELWKIVTQTFRYIHLGPGEKIIETIAHGLIDRNDLVPAQSLPGAVYFENNKIINNTPDMPSLARPDFTGLNMKFYTSCINSDYDDEQKGNLNHIQFFKWPFPHTLRASDMNRSCLSQEKRREVSFIPYIFNYNCSFKCAFCVQSNPDRHGVLTKTAELVVDDIAILIKKYNTRYFYFFNNTFNSSPGFVRKFYSCVKERKLKFYWSDCARFNNLNEELIDMMYESGCRKLIFGFETGSKKILDMIDKRIDLDHAENVIRLCWQRGIWVDVEVIIGLPHEYDEDFKETCDFILRNRKHLNTFAVNKYFVVPTSLIGMKPQNYNIELIENRFEYEEILEKNKKQLLCAQNERDEKVSVSNFRIFSFKEINGRSAEQIEADTNRKFSEAMQLYKSLDITDEIRLCNLHLAMQRKRSLCPDNLDK
jgi:radical SAM superfamily enzyme YgiQ (UPF0313 family)